MRLIEDLLRAGAFNRLIGCFIHDNPMKKIFMPPAFKTEETATKKTPKVREEGESKGIQGEGVSLCMLQVLWSCLLRDK